jgi:cell division septation protein DedD
MAAAATPAVADVKAGVDAWQQGDYAKAIGEWRPAAAAGDADAQFNLGQAYKLGRGVPVDLPIAMDWFRKAAAQGHERAGDNLGLLLFQQGKRDDAMPYIRKSADRGEPRAQYILGTALFNGDIVAKDWITAYALMTRASAAGLNQASNSLVAMDKYISVEDRQKGLALAAKMTDAAKPEQTAAVAPPAKPAKPVPAAAPVAPRRVAEAVPPPRAPAPPPKELPPAPEAIASAEPPKAKPVPPQPRHAVKPPPPVAEAIPPTEVAAAPAPVPKAAKPTARPPARPPATEVAMAKPPPSGNWRVQLGAFKEAPRAKALWQTATSKVSGLSAYKLYLVSGEDVTRVQAGPIASQADASRLCGKLQASGYSCMVKQN